MMSIGEIIVHYDRDKVFPMLGFGGRKSGDRITNHCFSLLGHEADGICLGLNGLQSTYRQALCEWRLSEPTCFSQVIRRSAQMAAENLTYFAGGVKYICLLILADGEMADLEATIEAIIDASSLPMSILIVGIGCEDFSKMKAMCSDKRLLSNGHRTATRNIVQFVEFNRFTVDTTARLAQELLAGLPGQMVEYYLRSNILPQCEQRPTADSLHMADMPTAAHMSSG
ncbi:hypothetical protein Vafri_897 [Volvox africanus]|nr:hypothetical protein Vafri_897 [Volvox africanus]